MNTKTKHTRCFNAAGVNLKELKWGQAKVVEVLQQPLRFSDSQICGRMLMGRSTHADLATLLVFSTKTF